MNAKDPARAEGRSDIDRFDIRKSESLGTTASSRRGGRAGEEGTFRREASRSAAETPSPGPGESAKATGDTPGTRRAPDLDPRFLTAAVRVATRFVAPGPTVRSAVVGRYFLSSEPASIRRPEPREPSLRPAWHPRPARRASPPDPPAEWLPEPLTHRPRQERRPAGLLVRLGFVLARFRLRAFSAEAGGASSSRRRGFGGAPR